MPRRPRKLVLVTVLGAIALASFFGFAWDWRQRHNSADWFSSPTAERASEFSLIAPLDARVEPTTADFEMRIEPVSETYFRVHESGAAGSWSPPVDVIEAGPKLVAELPGGAKLVAMALATSVQTAENPGEWGNFRESPLRFFEPRTLDPLADDIVEALHPRPSPWTTVRHVDGFAIVESDGFKSEQKWIYSRPVWLGLDLMLEPGSLEGDFRFENATVYDARTHARVGVAETAVEALASGQQLLRLRGSLTCFHRAPLIVHLIVAHPPQVIEIPAEQGREFDIGPAHGTVVVAAPGNWVVDSDEIERSDESGFTVFVQLSQKIHAGAWALRGLDKNGEELGSASRLPARGSELRFDQSGPLEMNAGVHFDTTPAKLELKIWPAFSHVLFRIEDIPGLPAENRDLDDLFDVRLPRIEPTDDRELLGIIARATQMGLRDSAPPRTADWLLTDFPDGHFPHLYEGMTARELLDEYRRHSRMERFSTEPDDPLVIQVWERPPSTWLDRAKAWLPDWLAQPP